MGNVYVPSPSRLFGPGGQVALEVSGQGSGASPTVGIFTGNWEVNGTATKIQTVNLEVADKNIELAAVTSPTDSTADGGGLTLKGATDKTILWTSATEAWNFNQGINVTSGYLGVGTTAPVQPLHIQSNNNNSDPSVIIDNDNAGGTCGLGFRSGVSDNYTIGVAKVGTNFRIANGPNLSSAPSLLDINRDTGNVGLGTDDPAYALDIVPSSSSALRIKGSTNGVDVNCAIENTGTSAIDDALLSLTTPAGAGDPSIRFAIAGNETWSIGIDNSDGDKLKFSQNSTLHTDTRVTFQGNKVGIGTESPTTTLDVLGTFKVSGVTTLSDVAYTWPTSDGSSGNQLTTDGAGNLSWAPSGGSGGDTTFTVSDGTNNTTIEDSDTLNVTGGRGIHTTVSSDTVTITRVYKTEGITLTTGSPTATGSTGKDLYTVNADTVGGTFTIPNANSMGATASQTVPVWVKNINSSNSMTLKTAGGNIDNIVGSSGVVLNALASILLVSDGSNFHVL